MATAELFTIPAAAPVTALAAGIHPVGPPSRSIDREMDCYELVFLRAGQLPIMENDREFLLGSDDALILWPGRRHRGHRDYTADMWFFWLCFHLPALPRKRTPDKSAITFPQCTRVQRPDRLVQWFEMYLLDQEQGRHPAPSADLLASLMLAEVAARRPAADIEGRPSETLAVRAARWIESQIDRGHIVSTADVADHLHCHPDYLGRVFREVYGLTVVEHLHRRWVDRAGRWLQETDWPWEKIATRLGFRDEGYLRRLFRRQTGMAPGAYRKLHDRVGTRPGLIRGRESRGLRMLLAQTRSRYFRS